MSSIYRRGDTDTDRDTGVDTVITDFTPIEGEPRKPLYPKREVSDRNEGRPGKLLLVSVILVAVCAVLVMLAVPSPR